MDDIISHLKSRKIKFVPRFAPYFIASFGAHVFNLYNKQSEVYTEHGRVPDTRMHTLFVAPPGFFKSFLMKILTNEQYGVLNAPDGNGKPVVPMRFESMVTEGGWTGSYTKDQKGATIAAPGLAQEFSSGIVCFEEFSAMTQTMKQQHSSTLDAALLTSLAEGEVRKRMVSGSISYETNITLWAGTQQGRFDLASGLGRRLFFVNWVPSIREANELKEAFWAGMNIPLDKPDLTKLRTKVCTTVEKINKVVSVQFDPQIKDFLMGVPHFEHSLFTRFCLGYHLMTSRFGRDVYVTADDSMKNLLSEAIGYREHLLASAEGDQVIQILIQSGGEASGQDICDRMLGFGSSVRQTRRILWYLTNRSRMITCNEKADTFKLRRKRRS